MLANDTLYAVVEAFELKVKNGWNHLSNNCFRSGIERAPAGKELLENLSKVNMKCSLPEIVALRISSLILLYFSEFFPRSPPELGCIPIYCF